MDGASTEEKDIETEAELQLREDLTRPCLRAKVVGAGASGTARAQRNLAQHSLLGEGAAALAVAAAKPQRSQRAGRRRGALVKDVTEEDPGDGGGGGVVVEGDTMGASAKADTVGEDVVTEHFVTKGVVKKAAIQDTKGKCYTDMDCVGVAAMSTHTMSTDALGQKDGYQDFFVGEVLVDRGVQTEDVDEGGIGNCSLESAHRAVRGEWGAEPAGKDEGEVQEPCGFGVIPPFPIVEAGSAADGQVEAVGGMGGMGGMIGMVGGGGGANGEGRGILPDAGRSVQDCDGYMLCKMTPTTSGENAVERSTFNEESGTVTSNRGLLPDGGCSVQDCDGYTLRKMTPTATDGDAVERSVINVESGMVTSNKCDEGVNPEGVYHMFAVHTANPYTEDEAVRMRKDLMTLLLGRIAGENASAAMKEALEASLPEMVDEAIAGAFMEMG